MLYSVLNLMKSKCIDKFQDEVEINSSICFNCKIDAKSEELEDNAGIFSCPKCKRAFYCSLKCMKKMKDKHESVCLKYFKNYQRVNDIVDEYISKKL